MNAAAPYCIQCGYNLTALESPRCPECGWVIDWRLARTDEEGQRPGTPVYRARGWRRWPAILSTLALMLFRPIRFARSLRYDEPLWPAVVVAVAAYLITFVPVTLREFHNITAAAAWNAIYCLVILLCIASNLLMLILLLPPWPRRPSLRHRLRLLLLLSLYSTCFVAVWNVADGPPMLNAWNGARFFWPLAGSLGDQFDRLTLDECFLGRTVIFYWWFAIIFAFAIVRSRPRWTASVFIVAVPIYSRLCYWIGELAYRKLGL